MEQNLNDKTACLVTAFQSGDVSAFSTLYDMHINLLFNYGCKLTTDKELLKLSMIPNSAFFVYNFTKTS